MTAENGAGLSVSVISSPLIYDDTLPVPGDVMDGSSFLKDEAWVGSNSTFSGQSIGCVVIKVTGYRGTPKLRSPLFRISQSSRRPEYGLSCFIRYQDLHFGFLQLLFI